MYDDFDIDEHDGLPTGLGPTPDEVAVPGFGAGGLQVHCKFGCAYFDLEDVNITGRHEYEITFQCPICNEYQTGKVLFLE